VPHFGEEGIGSTQAAKQAEDRVYRAEKRTGNRHLQGGKEDCND
jgi:hypothetical protein